MTELTRGLEEQYNKHGPLQRALKSFQTWSRSHLDRLRPATQGSSYWVSTLTTFKPSVITGFRPLDVDENYVQSLRSITTSQEAIIRPLPPK